MRPQFLLLSHIFLNYYLKTIPVAAASNAGNNFIPGVSALSDDKNKYGKVILKEKSKSNRLVRLFTDNCTNL